MQEVFKRIALVAPTEATVVITGESGTGKELIARAINQNWLRTAGPLVPNPRGRPEPLTHRERTVWSPPWLIHRGRSIAARPVGNGLWRHGVSR